MIRKIIEINEERCNGCGACVNACHEGAIVLEGGKAKLLREDFCDGLGDCLPKCPENAISFTEREAAEYDEEAVKREKEREAAPEPKDTKSYGCPGRMIKKIQHSGNSVTCKDSESMLAQWPVQIKLVPVNAPYFENADLLIAADCTAYAYKDFHSNFMDGKITMIGCPKLDSMDYTEKLTEIVSANNIRSITAVRMEVPCCGGIEHAVRMSVEKSGKDIPSAVSIIGIDGKILV